MGFCENLTLGEAVWKQNCKWTLALPPRHQTECMYGYLGMQAGRNKSFLHDHFLHPQVPEEVCISKIWNWQL
jgi:hypothetical protein